MQKLYSARLLLQHLDQLDQQNDLVRPAYATAHGEAVVFHLQGALQALLYEIAETARMPVGNWRSVGDLQAAAQSQNRVLPQLDRLVQLERESFSWLSQLNRRYQACWLPEIGKAESAPAEMSGAQLISVSQDTSSDQQQLNLWLDNLQGLITDLRQTMQEF